MNNRLYFRSKIGVYLLIFGIAWIIAGCTNTSATIPTSTEKTSLVQPSTTLVINNQNPIGSSTPTLILLSTSTPIPTIIPTIIPTPEPTLTTKERQNYILDLLKTNDACRFPCLWGITPGKSVWNSTRSFLSHFAPLIIDEKDTNEISHWVPLQISIEQQSTNAEVYFIERDNHIDLIHGEMTSDDFDNYLHLYTVREIINQFGSPSRVELYLPPGNHTVTSKYVGYKLWLFFNPNGIVLEYWGGAQKIGADYHICPTQIHYDYLGPGGAFSEKYGVVWFAFQSPENKRSLAILAENEDKDISKARSILDASGININEFSKLVTQDNKAACFNTAIDIWK